jgi:hypothetical protein
LLLRATPIGPRARTSISQRPEARVVRADRRRKCSLGGKCRIADQVLGGFEAIDVDDLGNQDSGCGYADAWNRGEVAGLINSLV